MNCSDYSTAWVCRTCGSMVSLGYDELAMGKSIGFGDDEEADLAAGPGGEYCRVCREEGKEERRREKKDKGALFHFESVGRGGDLEVVAVPFVYRLLVAELASMGIQIRMGLD